MVSDFLSIEITQLKEKLDSLEDNYYFNDELSNYFKNLQLLSTELSEKISGIGTKSVSTYELSLYRTYLDFIKNSCIYLEDSTLNIIPYETVFCLNKALSDWVTNPPIIVTSLKAQSYFFNGSLSTNEATFRLIESEFQITFKSRLILLGIPQIEVYNYLYNIVLYHELGHYVDQYHQISYKLTYSYIQTQL